MNKLRRASRSRGYMVTCIAQGLVQFASTGSSLHADMITASQTAMAFVAIPCYITASFRMLISIPTPAPPCQTASPPSLPQTTMASCCGRGRKTWQPSTSGFCCTTSAHPTPSNLFPQHMAAHLKCGWRANLERPERRPLLKAFLNVTHHL